MKARFIAIEGLDGSGGTTQTRALADLLRARGTPTHITREPSDGPIGQLIRRALRNSEPLSEAVLPYLFAADRRDHLDRIILPRLDAGTWVISDRYLASSLAYQSIVATFDRVVELNRDYPMPDLTVQLDLSPETCMARIAARGAPRERFENLDRLRAISRGYDAALTWTEKQGGKVVRIDASWPVPAVTQAIREALDSASFRF